MANICDYIIWRGDLSFEIEPFNEVDNLLLANLSYLNFSGIISEDMGRGMPLYKAAAIYFKEQRDQLKNSGDLMLEGFFLMLRLMANCKRYKNLKLKMYTEKVDLDEEMQFGALTIDLGNQTQYVSFRGTDDTLVGWKEDFKMSVMDIVPAQREALSYLEKVAWRYRGYKLYVGGHSKGGNLAVFAAVHASPKIKKRILQVYNNDGPGFKETLLDTQAYLQIADRIQTFVPQSSVIGMLLEHEENYTVIQSNQKGLMQHDGLSWEVSCNHFVHLKNITLESQMIDRTIKRFLNELSLEKRLQFTDALFDVLACNANKTLTDIREESWKGVFSMLKSYEQLDKEIKKLLNDVIGMLLTEGIRSIFEEKKPKFLPMRQQ